MASSSPTLEYVNRFIIKGLSVVTSNNAEANQHTANLPTLWQQFSANRLEQEAPAFCVYWSYEAEITGLYKATIGTPSKNIQGPLETVSIQEGNYLVFQKSGPKPAILIEIWNWIWHFFENNTDYQRTFKTDFEKYTDEDSVTVYIGIK